MGIRVNAIAPLSIETPMYRRSVTDERRAAMVNAIPVRRIGPAARHRRCGGLSGLRCGGLHHRDHTAGHGWR